MALDPAAKALMDQIAAMGGPQLHEMTPAQARESFNAMAAIAGAPIELAGVEDRTVPGPAGEIPVRVYRPQSQGTLPLLVYFHGGGWVIGDLDTHDRTCRALAVAATCAVIAVDYRLAPENKFPAAAEDCYAAFLWSTANAAQLGADAARVAVGGDSAGGNLAAVVAQMARDRGGPLPVFQLLIYPATDARCDTASFRDNGEGYFLTAAGMRWFWDHYLRTGEDAAHPYASPLRAEELHGLPPALVITAEYDPLRDEGEAYAERLRQAGVAARTRRFAGMIHGFVGMGGVLPQGDRALDEAAEAMRLVCGRGGAD
jgi:acetyl esterase